MNRSPHKPDETSDPATQPDAAIPADVPTPEAEAAPAVQKFVPACNWCHGPCNEHFVCPRCGPRYCPLCGNDLSA